MIFSGCFVVTRFCVTRELQIWDITALRFSLPSRPNARLLPVIVLGVRFASNAAPAPALPTLPQT
jgi:hypothetical protein